jgi:hypothetical protein
MFNLDNLKIEVWNFEIQNIVIGVTIYEKLFGLYRGSIAVKDGLNIFDKFIGSHLAPVTMTWEYLGKQHTAKFWMDGISNMEIEKNQKNYIIHIKSSHETNFIERLNSTFSGTSDEIIRDMFFEVSEDDAVLYRDSRADTEGRYIAPNITAREAFKAIVNSAHDVEKSGFFLYQRFMDNNALRLTSLNDMMTNPLMNPNADPIRISNAQPGMDSIGVDATVGTGDSFSLKEYNMNFLQKLEKGVYGEAVSEVGLDETTKKDNLKHEDDATSVQTIKFKLSKKLYDEGVTSVFSDVGSVENVKMVNKKFRVYNTSLNAASIVAVPYIGVGMTIELDLGGGNVSYSKQDGPYLVATMQHKWTQDGGNFAYYQDLGLIRP